MRSVAAFVLIVGSWSLSVTAFNGAAASAVMASDQQPSSAAAERVLQETLYDVTGSYYLFACSPDGEVLPIEDGELVRVEGKIYERLSVVIDGAGGGHYSVNIMPIGLRVSQRRPAKNSVSARSFTATTTSVSPLKPARIAGR